MGRSYKDLVAWKRAMELVTAACCATAKFPKDEWFGLTSQLRRAAVSVPSNIAEGQGRLSQKESRYFLGQSPESLMEVETQLQIANNLGYWDAVETNVLLNSCAEVGRILNGLIASICKDPDLTAEN
jgi:four helix bundle protein